MPIAIPNAVRHEPCVSVRNEGSKDIARAVVDAQKEGYNKIVCDSYGVHMYKTLPIVEHPPDVTLVVEDVCGLPDFSKIIKKHLNIDIDSEIDGILNPKK